VQFCEICDDGAANDDAAPDACRTDCRPARCGDTVIDSDETCDDGNLTSCDGCDATCQTEVALGCGNGLALPGCGEQCDDGNLGDGDGCSPTCQNELISGGGSAKFDCLTAWSVDNPSNTPRLGSDGSFNRKQRCNDNDPACDFDGGAVGSCTFQLRMCGNVTALASCVPSPQLASWKLDRPSERDAQKSAVAAAVVDALTGSVPGAIVGPRGTDLCSATVAVVVPLAGHAGRFRAGKRSLRTTAQDYAGTKDIDKLDLRCLPSS
jgi:cysteine-rich repeat protein